MSILDNLDKYIPECEDKECENKKCECDQDKKAEKKVEIKDFIQKWKDKWNISEDEDGNVVMKSKTNTIVSKTDDELNNIFKEIKANFPFLMIQILKGDFAQIIIKK